jgi:rod shape-determining protein MreD
MYIRLQLYPLLQQGLSIFIFVLLYQFILYCVQGFIGELPSSPLYWGATVTSVLLWPWLFVLMRDCHRSISI